MGIDKVADQVSGDEAQPLLVVNNLKQYFPIPGRRVVKAIDDISFDIMPGETVGLVGESGSGKSTCGRAVIKLDEITSGQIVFDGRDISGKMSRDEENYLRENMSMVFQDSGASLNPYRKVIDTIATGLDAHMPGLDKRERERRVYEMMDRVGLSRSQANRYPSQFSGGQRQRVCLARALIMNPKLVIADEAISALDVSIQAQVVNLMKDIQEEMGTAYLFIAHDLSMVRYISSRICVMHLGHIVEKGRTDEIFANPVHPYTKSLISAIPQFNPETERDRVPITYDVHEAGIDYTKGSYHNVSGQHFVLATDEEFSAWAK